MVSEQHYMPEIQQQINSASEDTTKAAQYETQSQQNAPNSQ